MMAYIIWEVWTAVTSPFNLNFKSNSFALLNVVAISLYSCTVAQVMFYKTIERHQLGQDIQEMVSCWINKYFLNT